MRLSIASRIAQILRTLADGEDAVPPKLDLGIQEGRRPRRLAESPSAASENRSDTELLSGPNTHEEVLDSVLQSL